MGRWLFSVWMWLSVAAIGAALPTTARAEPYGPPFQVTTTGGFNFATMENPGARVDLATGANGDTIALWQSGPESAPSFYIQRYDARGGSLIGTPLSVGTAVRQVAVSGLGNYALVTEQPDGSGNGVFVTLVNRAGTVMISRLRVNDSTAGEQRLVGIAMNASGMFSVSWSERTESYLRLYLKRFQANGVAVASETLVLDRQVPTTFLAGGGLAIDGAGNTFVTWSVGDFVSQDPSDIWARRYGTNGAALGPAFRVNSSHARSQQHALAMNGSGSAVVVWTGVPAGSTTSALLGQRYSASGAALGPEFRVSEDVADGLEGLDVAMDPLSGFVVTWHQEGLGVIPQIVARAFNSAGLPLASAFPVTEVTNTFATNCAIGMDQAGNFAISWLEHHYTNDPTNRMVARRYYPMGIQVQSLTNGQTVSGIAGASNSFRYFKLTVPSGHVTLDASIFGGPGDADLYVRLAALPTLTAWDGRPYLSGNNEAVRMLRFPPGDWYIGVHGYSAYNGLNLQGRSY